MILENLTQNAVTIYLGKDLLRLDQKTYVLSGLENLKIFFNEKESFHQTRKYYVFYLYNKINNLNFDFLSVSAEIDDSEFVDKQDFILRGKGIYGLEIGFLNSELLGKNKVLPEIDMFGNFYDVATGTTKNIEMFNYIEEKVLFLNDLEYNSFYPIILYVENLIPQNTLMNIPIKLSIKAGLIL